MTGFTESDMELIDGTVINFSISLQNASLYADAQQKIKELTTLSEVSNKFVVTDSLKEYLKIISNATYDLIPLTNIEMYEWIGSEEVLKRHHLLDSQRKKSVFPSVIALSKTDVFTLLNEKYSDTSRHLSSMIWNNKGDSHRCHTVLLKYKDEFFGIVCFVTQEDYTLTKSNKQILSLLISEAVTNYKLAEPILKASKLITLGELTARILHDIKSSLTSISGYAQLLPERTNDLKFLNKMGTVIEEETDRMNNTIYNFLSYSQKTEKENGSINDIIERVM